MQLVAHAVVLNKPRSGEELVKLMTWVKRRENVPASRTYELNKRRGRAEVTVEVKAVKNDVLAVLFGGSGGSATILQSGLTAHW